MKKRFKRTWMLVFPLALLLAFAAAGSVSAASTKTTLKKKVNAVLSANTDPADTKKGKLEKLFTYAEKEWGYDRVIGFNVRAKNWSMKYAIAMYNRKKGSCYHFAAAYAYLAKKATGYKTRIAVGKTRGFNAKVLQPHAWMEIKIGKTWYVCDPNLDKFAADSSGRYFLKKRTSLKKIYNNYKSVKYMNVTL